MTLRPRDFESRASASSATPAGKGSNIPTLCSSFYTRGEKKNQAFRGNGAQSVMATVPRRLARVPPPVFFR